MSTRDGIVYTVLVAIFMLLVCIVVSLDMQNKQVLTEIDHEIDHDDSVKTEQPVTRKQFESWKSEVEAIMQSYGVNDDLPELQ